MAAFGSGINPSLGATNYGGFLQGALQGAQSAARGNEMVAQGIQQAGQQISALAQQYMQKKEKRELEEQAISAFQNIAQANPGLAKQLGVNAGDRSAIKYVVNGIGAEKALGLAGALEQQEQQQKIEQEREQAAKYGLLYKLYNGNIPSMYAVNAFPASARMAGTNMALEQDLLRAQINKANTQKPTVGRVVTEDEFNAYKNSGMDVDGVPNPDGSITLTKIGSFAPAPTTNINVGEKTESTETAKAKVDRNVKLLTAAQSGMDSMRKAVELKTLIETGDVNTGIFAPIKQGLDRFIAGFGGQEAIKRASATELAQAFMGSEVFQLFQQLGVGARGLDTPAERDFMIKVLTGDVTMQKEAILGMAKRRFDEARRDVENFNSRVSGSEGYRNWVKEYNYDVPEYTPLEWGASDSDVTKPDWVSKEQWDVLTPQEKATFK